MTDTLLEWSGAAALVLVIVLGIALLSSSSPKLGASYNGDVVSNPQWFSNGLYAGSSQQFAVTSTGGVTSGNLSIPTAAGATSTLTVGEINTYATSSATKVCLFLSTKGATSTYKGTVYFKYGSCP